MDRVEWFLFWNSFKDFVPDLLATPGMKNLKGCKKVVGHGDGLEGWSVLGLRRWAGEGA